MAEPRVCSMMDCDNEPRYGQRYCPECHKKYMRAWRAKKRRKEGILYAEAIELRLKCVALEKEVEELKRKLATYES